MRQRVTAVTLACGLGLWVVGLDGLEPVTSSVSSLLTDLAHMRQGRPRCLRCSPGVTVTTLGRPPHRAREGHGQHLQIHSFVSDPDDRHADHLGLDVALRAVEPPGDDRARECPNGFQELLCFPARDVIELGFSWGCLQRRSRSSRVYPARTGIGLPADDSVTPWSSPPSPGLLPATRPLVHAVTDGGSGPMQAVVVPNLGIKGCQDSYPRR